MFWAICISISQPKLVLDISSKSVHFVPSRGDAGKRCQTFQIEMSNLKTFARRLSTKGTYLLEMSGTNFGGLVNRAIQLQISENIVRVP